MSGVDDIASTVTQSGVGTTAKHSAVLNHPWSTESQQRTSKCQISIGSKLLPEVRNSSIVLIDVDPSPVIVPLDGDPLAEQHSPLCATAAEPVDIGLVQSCTTEPLDQLAAGTIVLPNVGCGATDSDGSYVTFDPPCVDWDRILQAQEGPWLIEINRDYVEVS